MLSLGKIFKIFNNNNVSRVFYKKLATNDNSKNQVFLGSGWDTVSILPLEEITESSANFQTSNFKCHLNFYWLSQEGELCHAPRTKLILYSKYPEVRLSGFIDGCSDKNRLSRLMNAQRNETIERILILGVTNDDKILSHVLESDSNKEGQLKEISLSSYGKLTEIKFSLGMASIDELVSRIKEIINKGWVPVRSLTLKDGKIVSNYKDKIANNSHGVTLEAELGVTANSSSGPDWRGWEIKSKRFLKYNQIHHSKPVSLFTPAPDFGLYSYDYELFMDNYGFFDVEKNRISFAQMHKYQRTTPGSQLTLVCSGFENGIIKGNGSIDLIDPGDNIVASWKFSKLLGHWNRKHQNFVLIPAMVCLKNGIPHAKYFGYLKIGKKTDFNKFISAFVNTYISYEPGCWIDNQNPSRRHERHQWRILSGRLEELYHNFEIRTI
jgi:hypothetical protein